MLRHPPAGFQPRKHRLRKGRSATLRGMRPDWKDVLAMILAAYSLILPPVLAILGLLLLAVFLLRLLV